MFYKPLTTIGSLGYLLMDSVTNLVTILVIHNICDTFGDKCSESQKLVTKLVFSLISFVTNLVTNLVINLVTNSVSNVVNHRIS